MEYLWKPMSSSITPVLSHLLAKMPAALWFLMKTCWPETSFGNALVCSDHLSTPKLTLWRSILYMSNSKTRLGLVFILFSLFLLAEHYVQFGMPIGKLA